MEDDSVENIDINDLFPTGHVNANRVGHFMNDGDGVTEPVKYVRGDDGNLYIIDGNHRWFSAVGQGKTEISAIESDLPIDVKSSWLKNLFNRER